MWMLFSLAMAGELDACFAAPVDAREPYRCAYKVARTTNDYDAVITRVRAEVLAHPDHPWGIHTLGSLLTDHGERDEGVRAFEQARTMFDGGDDVLGRVYARLNLGTHLQHQHHFEESRTAYLEAAAIAAEHERPDLEHAAKLSLARSLVTNGERLGEAWALANEVEQAVFPDGDYQTRLLALHVLGLIATATGRYQELALLLERKVAMATEAGDTYVLEGAQLSLAETLVGGFADGDRPNGVVARIEGMLDGIAKGSDPFYAAQSWCARARLLRFEGRRTQAEASARKCVEGLRPLEDLDSLREALVEHATCSSGSTAEGSWAEATTLADSDEARATVTLQRLEWLSGGVDHLATRKLVPEVRKAVATLRESWADHTSQSALGRTRLHALESAAVALSRSHSDEALLLADIQRGSSAEAGLTLAAVQDSIPGNTTLVVYLLPPSSDAGVALVIGRAAYRVVDLKDAYTLHGRVQTLNSLIRAQDPLADQMASTLHAQLIEPLGLITDRVVVFPTGPLHGVPFDALGKPGSRLGEQRVLSVGTTLVRWIERDATPLTFERAVLMADPENPGAGLAALPEARTELAAVRAALGSDRPMWMGPDAKPEALLDAEADWIHLAAHVVVDDRFPDRTAVHLANGQTVTAAQVRNTAWKRPTVVLSACRSAGGPVFGDGPLGMSRAFVDGGASAVIGSLWPLRDADAARFFAVFYEELVPGTRLDLALSRTRRKLAAEGAPLEAWAGVVLVGDSTRKLPEESSGRGWLGIFGAMLGALLLIPVALWWRWR